ncbi:RNA polymerase sigma factor [Hungatella hathewayi]|uniref:RNA polymerase sigma factor n=1 Tax=Hungatella hathewayi TaxID=154046 RepID=UPI003566DE28
MESINWNEILEQEDRIIANSDRKQRYHFSSLDAMSEELVYQESIARYQEQEFYAGKDGDFTDQVRDERLAAALKLLTPKQKEVIELIFWKGYTQEETARELGCSQSSVSERLSNGLKRLAGHLKK